MKIFNVSLHVRITQIAEIPDNPATDPPAEKKPFNDDPVDKQENILNNFLNRMVDIVPRPGAMVFASESEQASMNRSVKVQAETFEDLAAILQRFSDTLKSIPAIDASLLKVAQPVAPPTPQYG